MLVIANRTHAISQMPSLHEAKPAGREGLSLEYSAHEYQVLMQDGHLSSKDLVNYFLDQIERHNNLGLKLKAILSVCPRDLAISQAKVLDEERRQGKVRSDLHGIPIVVKVGETRAQQILRRGSLTHSGLHCHSTLAGHGLFGRLKCHCISPSHSKCKPSRQTS